MRKEYRLYQDYTIHGLEQAHAHTRALPFDAGASLPIVQRYTDPRFRAVCKRRLRYSRDEHKAEVYAVLKIVGIDLAKAIFHWSDAAARYAEGLLQELEADKAADAYYRANMRELGVAHVLALLQAAREGGWVKGHDQPVPDVVRLAMRASRDEGLNIAQIAERFGFSYWTTSYAFRTPHRERMAMQRVGLVL